MTDVNNSLGIRPPGLLRLAGSLLDGVTAGADVTCQFLSSDIPPELRQLTVLGALCLSSTLGPCAIQAKTPGFNPQPPLSGEVVGKYPVSCPSVEAIPSSMVAQQGVQ